MLRTGHEKKFAGMEPDRDCVSGIETRKQGGSRGSWERACQKLPSAVRLQWQEGLVWLQWSARAFDVTKGACEWTPPPNTLSFR